MMKHFRHTQIAIVMAIASVSPLTLNAQQVCPCVPAGRMWVSNICDTWNCAMAALVSANGDTSVFAVPVATDDPRWLVVRQVTSGDYADDSPFRVESFDGVAAATARFAAVATDNSPHIISAPDGKLLVISLRQPETSPTRRRSVGH